MASKGNDWFREALVNRDRKGRFSKKAGGGLSYDPAADMMGQINAQALGIADPKPRPKKRLDALNKSWDAVVTGEGTKEDARRIVKSARAKLDPANPVVLKAQDMLKTEGGGLKPDGTLKPEAIMEDNFDAEALNQAIELNKGLVERTIGGVDQMFPTTPNNWNGRFKAYTPDQAAGAAFFNPNNGDVAMNVFTMMQPEHERLHILQHEAFHTHSKMNDPREGSRRIGYEEGVAELMNRTHRRKMWEPFLGKRKAKEYDEKLKNGLDHETPYDRYVEALDKIAGISGMDRGKFAEELYKVPVEERATKAKMLAMENVPGLGASYELTLDKIENAHDVLMGWDINPENDDTWETI